MIATDGYLYNGKVIDRSEEIQKISKRLPSLEHIIVVEYINTSKDIDKVLNFKTVCQSDRLENFVLCKFNDPLYIVFSSGTTGKPKCITHSIGGRSNSTRKRTLASHKFECPAENVLFYYMWLDDVELVGWFSVLQKLYNSL